MSDAIEYASKIEKIRESGVYSRFEDKIAVLSSLDSDGKVIYHIETLGFYLASRLASILSKHFDGWHLVGIFDTYGEAIDFEPAGKMFSKPKMVIHERL